MWSALRGDRPCSDHARTIPLQLSPPGHRRHHALCLMSAFKCLRDVRGLGSPRSATKSAAPSRLSCVQSNEAIASAAWVFVRTPPSTVNALTLAGSARPGEVHVTFNNGGGELEGAAALEAIAAHPSVDFAALADATGSPVPRPWGSLESTGGVSAGGGSGSLTGEWRPQEVSSRACE